MKIEISKLAHAEQSGDWHDKPLRWQVAGPLNELQKFPTKVGAKLYTKIRRHAATSVEAIHAFVDAELSTRV